MNNNRLWALVEHLLNDEHGINEDAYYALIDVIHERFSEEAAVHLANMVDATDGRFYLPEDAKHRPPATKQENKVVSQPMELICEFSGWCSIDAQDVLLQDTETGEVATAQEFYDKRHEQESGFDDLILYDFAKLVKDADELDFDTLDLELKKED